MSGRILEGWIRLSILAEKGILLENRDKYHGLVIPAHVFALYRNSISLFLEVVRKPYFIDPMSYVFFQERLVVRRPDGRTKRSYVKMTEHSPRILNFLEEDSFELNSLSPNDISTIFDGVTDVAFSSQMQGVPFRRSQDSLIRIRRMLRTDEEHPLISSPSFLVTPYVLIDTVGDENVLYSEWLRSMNRFEELVRRNNENIPIYKMMCISPKILQNPHQLSRLMQDIGSPQGIVFWVDEFEKCDPDNDCLDGLRTFISGMKTRGVENVFSLYGGYLTAAFHEYGLDTLSYGLSSGDSKSASKGVTGGGAPSRYYFPDLHSYQTTNRLARFFRNSIECAHHFNCTCPICNETTVRLHESGSLQEIRQHLNSFFIQRGSNVVVDWHDERRHFLFVREQELDHISRNDIHILGEEAQETLDNYVQLGDNELDFRTLNLVVILSQISNR
jgi:hypothetical protein